MNKTGYQDRTEGLHPCLCDRCLIARGEELERYGQEIKKQATEEIKKNIVQFAIEGKFERDEMKGLALYSKIMKYFDENASLK